MTDPLSIAGSVAGLVSLGIQVTQSLMQFYDAYKHLNRDLESTSIKLESLISVFESLAQTLSERKFGLNEQNLLRKVEASIIDCKELIEELQDECQRLRKDENSELKDTIKIVGRRVAYPFRQSTLQKLEEDVNEIWQNISVALTVLQLSDEQSILDESAEIKTVLELIRTDQLSSELRGWLNAPDSTIEYNAACAKKHPGTGAWLKDDPHFIQLLEKEDSFAWMNGFAGSGKSVLCSTAIQHILRHRRSDSQVGIAFFFFTFNDKSKRTGSAMLKALLLQLSTQLNDGYADLKLLHKSNPNGTPPDRTLLAYLQRLVARFRHAYLVLDALDESESHGNRNYLLDMLFTIRGWRSSGLHFLVTSRDEPDIRECLETSPDQEIPMQNIGINKDIEDFICGHLDADRRLRKFLPYREKIQNALMTQAKGCFRWVACQFEALRTCPQSEYHLVKLLGSLPRSLDETYERMLCNICDDFIEDARRIFTLLCFASRPLTVSELIDGVAVEIGCSPGLNKKRRLHDAQDIHQICPGFLQINLEPKAETEYREHVYVPTARIAHFSVQEYLESDRIRRQRATTYSLSSTTAHAEIVRICIVYLLDPGLSKSAREEKNIPDEYPLAPFAACEWYKQYRILRKAYGKRHVDSDLITLIVSLFLQKNPFSAWTRLEHFYTHPWNGCSDNFQEWLASSLHCISKLGFPEILNTTIESISTGWPSLYSSDEALAELLNTETAGETLLMAAGCYGSLETVELLLRRGADVNQRTKASGTALHEAARTRKGEVVQLLLTNGADVNIQGGYYGNALQAAYRDDIEIVQLLLERDANVNTQGGKFGNALQAAANYNNLKTVRLLLGRGANVNSQGGMYGNALQAAVASRFHSFEMIQLLLEKGADINAQGGRYSSALLAAILTNHVTNKKHLIIKEEADIVVRAEARRDSRLERCLEVMELLIDEGADIDARDVYGGTALMAAAYRGYIEMLQLLLNKGADVTAQDKKGRTALMKAVSGGHGRVVQYLIERGVDLNVRNEEGRNALMKAAERGHIHMVEQLLENGADIHAQSMYGNALQLASKADEKETVLLLLRWGAMDTTGASRSCDTLGTPTIRTTKSNGTERSNSESCSRERYEVLEHELIKDANATTSSVLTTLPDPAYVTADLQADVSGNRQGSRSPTWVACSR